VQRGLELAEKVNIRPIGKGVMGRWVVPSHSSLFGYMEDKALTIILNRLIQRSSLPLASVETQFAVDASGFSTCKTVTWYNARYGHEQDNHDWLKLHLMCGVKTNVVTSAMTGDRYGHDSILFPPLVASTAGNGFKVREVSADKAYINRTALDVVDRVGGTAYIPFKSNATGTARRVPGATRESCELWHKMYHYYNFNRDDFLQQYHKRSNVESTFAMIKAKFGGHLRCKTDVAIENEALYKVLCHNICCVIQSMHELGIEPTFWTESTPVREYAA
jgi:transposase